MVYVRPLYEKEVTPDFPPNGINQRSGGDITVYQDNKKGSWDVWMWKTGSDPVALASDASDQINPATDGKTVVWQDNRNGNWDIYAYDLNTSKEVQVTQDPTDQTNPDIENGVIVWQDNRNDNWDIYLYDRSVQEEKTICVESGDQTRPRIEAGRIVWEDNRRGDKDISSGARFIYFPCISLALKIIWGNSWSLKIFDLVRNCSNAVSQRCRRVA
jgi:beta propeller repeat protein